MMSANANQHRVLMVGNIAVNDSHAYPLPEVSRDPLAPAAWPKVIGSLSLLMGILGICFIPPPETMAVVTPQSQGAAELFPAWYPPVFGVSVLGIAVTLHIGLALAGVAALRYSPRVRLYYMLYALLYVAYIFGAVFLMIHVMSETDLASLTQAKRINILEAERTFYYGMAGSLVWPAFLIAWFLSPTVASQVRTWETAAFRERLKQRRQRRARG